MASIPSKMKAVITYGIHDYRCETIDVPYVAPNELLIRVEACGICAGDIKAYKGGEVFWKGERPYFEPPAIGGHEFVGEVVLVGATYKDQSVKVGDRIAVEPIVPCNECYFCKNGHYTACDDRNCYGFKYFLNGGFAQYARISANSLIHQVPKDLPLDKAVLIEPYACAMHAIDRAKITSNDNVVISGTGPLGLAMITIARSLNPKSLIALDLKDSRLKMAVDFGCSAALNPSKMNVIEAVRAATGGIGCDVYIEATGHPSSVLQGLEMVRKQGRFVEFSLFNEPVTCNWSIIGDTKELDIYGVCMSPYTFPRVIQAFAEGSLRTEGIVTHQFVLDDFQQAFDVSSAGSDSIKVIFVP